MQISVFGGSGFVGGEFCRTYPDEVEVVDRETIATEYPTVLDFVSTIDNYNVKTNPYIDIETNLHLLVEKLQYAKEFIGTETIYNFVSSWFVLGKTEVPADEESPCWPKGFYSATKLCAEQLVESYCRTFGMKFRILRLGNVIGIGNKKVSAKRSALQFMIKELAQGREINLYKDGTVRDFIDVRDVASAIHLVLEKGEPNQIYNIANGHGWSVEHLIDHAWAKAGYTGKINPVPAPEFHKQVQTNIMYLNIEKIKKLGYVQKYDIKQSVASLVEYCKNNET
jgi:nucleoside-diphosphate-sugar epimerase